MKKYDEVLKGLTEAAKKSTRHSKGDYVELTTALLNEDQHETTYYTNPSGDTPISVTKKPVHELRESMKGILSQFDIDKNELDKVHDITLDKKFSEALIDVAAVAQHDYISTGKKLRLPQMAADETTATLERVKLAKKVEATSKIVDGKQVPTGRTVETSERFITKSGNKVPGWLKKDI